MSELSVAIDGSDVAAASMNGVGIIRGTKYTGANHLLASVHGYETSQELVGREWGRLYSTEDEVTADELLAQVREEGEWRGRALGHRRNGTSVSVELSMRAADDEIVCAVRDITERREREQELDRYKTILNTVKDGVYVLDEDFCFSFVNKGLCELTELTREELVGRPVTDLFEYEDELAAVRNIRRRVLQGDTSIGRVQGTLETSEGQRALEARFRLHPEPDGEFWGSIGVVRDVTDWEERERRLERQRDELDTLNRINELLLTVVCSLFESSTVGDIEQEVCSRLADSDLYQFAWMGKPEVGGDRLVPDAVAGVDGGYVESITVTTDETEFGRGPVGRAFRTDEVQVSQDIRTDPSFEPWRQAAVDHDVRSAAAIPLTYDGRPTISWRSTPRVRLGSAAGNDGASRSWVKQSDTRSTSAGRDNCCTPSRSRNLSSTSPVQRRSSSKPSPTSGVRSRVTATSRPVMETGCSVSPSPGMERNVSSTLRPGTTEF